MKKRIALLLAALLAVGSLTACGGNEGSNNGTEGGDANTVKVGLGVHVDMTYGSKDADPTAEEGKQDGATQADLHVAAVTVDAEGKVVDVIVDSIQIKATFSTTGEVVLGTDQTFSTKRELGDNYMMEAIMGDACIGEWYFQADNFETWCIGKTADEIEAALGSDGYPTDDTLKTGCTIKVNGLVPAVVRAIEYATTNNVEAAATDVLGLGLVGETAKAQFDAAAENPDEAGASQAYANFVAVTSADGVITNCILDSVQANFTWNAEGKITSDLEAEPTTKYNLKEDYNMKGTSADIGKIEGGKEWYEQADVFMQFVNGKTADEVKAIPVNEEGKTTDETLSTGCTMTITAYISAVDKALNPAY